MWHVFASGFQPLRFVVSVSPRPSLRSDLGWYAGAPLALPEPAGTAALPAKGAGLPVRDDTALPVRNGHTRHTGVFAVVSTRCAARAGSGMLAAVNAHAVKESQTDLRFMNALSGNQPWLLLLLLIVVHDFELRVHHVAVFLRLGGSGFGAGGLLPCSGGSGLG